MTYARKMAIAANGAAKKGNSVVVTNGDQYAAVEGVILEVIERCAKEAEPGCGPNCMHSECKGASDAARRVRALLSTPAPEPGDRA